MRYLILTTMLVLALMVVGLFVSVSAPAQSMTFTGTLERGDLTFEDSGEFYDLYEIELEAGQYVDVYASSETFDTYLLINMPDGDEVHIDDYYTDDTNAGLLFIPSQAGTYTFYVSSHTAGETGEYEFTCEATTTKLEQSYQGELAQGDEVSMKGGEYYDRYTMTLGPNEKRVVSLWASFFDPHLAIHQPDGVVYFVNGKHATTLIEADENGGEYVLIATSIKTAKEGDYTLDIRSLVENDG